MGFAGGDPVVPLTPSERSLTNEPALSQARFVAARDRWRLLLDARFGNDCLADAGAAAGYVDLPPPSGGPARSRLLLVRQTPSPEGCPDIYQPVTRKLAVAMPPGDAIAHLLVMDLEQPEGEAGSELRLGIFAVADAGDSGEPSGAAATVPAAPLYGGSELPVLSDVVVSHGQAGRGERRYEVTFLARFPDRCHARRGLAAEIVESRTGVSDASGAAVVEWLFVAPGEGEPCTGAAGPPVTVRYAIVRERRGDYARTLVVVNPTTAAPAGRMPPFFVAELWPAAAPG